MTESTGAPSFQPAPAKVAEGAVTNEEVQGEASGSGKDFSTQTVLKSEVVSRVSESYECELQICFRPSED